MTTTQAAPLRAAIYARVSSEEQREGQTIDSQIAELERFAQAQDWIITGIYKDEGWSGAVLARPELDRLRDEASKDSFEIVLINDVDRLARDVSHLGVIRRGFERHKVRVRFRKLTGEQSPDANLMINILGSFAEFERELIADRTRRGRRHKVEVRQQFLGSRAPYGYRYRTKAAMNSRDGLLELIPEEALMVKQIYQWVDAEGLSAMKVRQRLNELQIPTKNRKPHWGKSSVLRVLHCETYTGLWHYNKHECYEPAGKEKRGYRKTTKYLLRRRPRAEWIPVPLPEHLRILDHSQWQRVQAQLARNCTFSPRNDRHHYLLKGLVRCGGCGAIYVGDPNHGTFYYRCLHRCKIYATIREEVLNAAVWDALTEALLNPALVLAQVERREQEQAAQFAHLQDDAAQVAQALTKLLEEETRLIEAYRLGILTAPMLQSQMEQLKARKTALQQKHAEYQEAGRIQKSEVVKAPLEAYCRDLARRLATMTWSERQRLLQLLIEGITYYGERIIIRAILPLDQQGKEMKLSEGGDDGGPELPHPSDYDDLTEGEVTDQQMQQRDRKLVFLDDRITPTKIYCYAHNPVMKSEVVHFEMQYPLPVPTPMFTLENLSVIRSLVERNPKATLTELCQQFVQRQRLTWSIQSMSRALQRLGFRYHKRRAQSKKSLWLGPSLLVAPGLTMAKPDVAGRATNLAAIKQPSAP